MNIHLPAILMFTRSTRFWHTAMCVLKCQNLPHTRKNICFFSSEKPLTIYLLYWLIRLVRFHPSIHTPRTCRSYRKFILDWWQFLVPCSLPILIWLYSEVLSQFVAVTIEWLWNFEPLRLCSIWFKESWTSDAWTQPHCLSWYHQLKLRFAIPWLCSTDGLKTTI